MDEEYRGFKIRFNTARDGWEALENGEVFETNTSRKALLAKIDAFIKAKDKFAPIPAFRIGYQDDVQICTVTSNAGEGNVWVTYKDKTFRSRGKESVNYLYMDTPENREKLIKWNGLKAEIAKLTSEAYELKQTFEKIKLPEVV